jgi:hypothetical protein
MSWLRTVGAWLADRVQPAEHYNSLNLVNWEVEVIEQRENPEDPVVLALAVRLDLPEGP